MSITLPDVPDGHVWITSPGWMFDHWHWTWFLAGGTLLFLVGVIVARLDGRSFATGFAIILSTGPIGLGLVGGAMSAFFWEHPRVQSPHEAWSAHETADQHFRVPRSHLDGTFDDPARVPTEDRATINTKLATAFSMEVLQPNRDAVFIRSDSTDDELNAKAEHAPAYSVEGQVYSCVFLTDGITRDEQNRIIRIDVAAAQCLQGDRSIRLTIHG